MAFCLEFGLKFLFFNVSLSSFSGLFVRRYRMHTRAVVKDHHKAQENNRDRKNSLDEALLCVRWRTSRAGLVT